MKTKIRKAQAGIPNGGTAGQALIKLSSSDQDVGFGNPSNVSFTVNADDTIIDWFTSQVPFPYSLSPWTASYSPTVYGNGYNVSANGGVSLWLANGFYDQFIGQTANSSVTFGLGRTYRMKVMAKNTTPAAAGKFAFIGFNLVNNQDDGDITVTASKRIGFAFNADGILYAVTCNGAATTATSLGAFTQSVHEYVIQVEGSTRAKFYVDGTLVATITTNLPSGAGDVVHIAVNGQTGAGGIGFSYVSNFILSQKLS